MSDMKPRSRDVTDGLERAPARGMLRAVGMGDEDFVKPQIGIASSWNEITPCNLSLARLALAAKEGVFSAGGFPMQFGTISVSDGISMGHEGMHFSLKDRARHIRRQADAPDSHDCRRLRACARIL
jgi:dihydroxy-acid dehydratase